MSDWFLQALSIPLAALALARLRLLAGNDAQSLHDLRVALRSLRVLLRLLPRKGKLKSLSAQWKALAQSTSRSRDLEVLLALCDAQNHVSPEQRQAWEQELARQRQDLLQWMASSSLPLLLAQTHQYVCKHNFSVRVGAYAKALLLALQLRLQGLNADSSPADWHALRLSVKRLRYLIEGAAMVLPARWQALLPSLKDCQQSLGVLHDLDLYLSQGGVVAEGQHASLLAGVQSDVLLLQGQLQRVIP